MARFTLWLVAVASLAIACASSASASRLTERSLDLDTHLVGGTPLVDPPKRVAGYFQLDRTYDAKMFYFYFAARNAPVDAPVVLWMTGGPGCSSEIAVFFENGPYTINDNMTLTETKYGWDVNSHMIFVDQPIGTGFSYSDDPRDRVMDETVLADDMLDFLQEFFAVHTDIAGNEFFITGESYAGHYVPAVSHRVWRAIKDVEGSPINLKGIAIGNGLTDAAIQFGAYADFAAENNLISPRMRDNMQAWYPLCAWGINLCNWSGWNWVCIVALQYCQVTTFEAILAVNPGINVYDITKQCEGDLCYDMSAADKFLNLPTVRAKLGVGDRTWESCNMDVHFDFNSDWLINYDVLLPEMLADGVRVLIYAGDLDFICNWIGNRRWVDVLPWHGAAEWVLAEDKEWQVDGKPAGTAKSVGNLTFLRVFQAGHMVPMDQPANALEMITKFTRGEDLVPNPSLSLPAASVKATQVMPKKVLGRMDVM